MRKFGIVALAVLLIAVVLFYMDTDKKLSIDHLLKTLSSLANDPPPTLTGGHTFDNFGEGAKSVFYITNYPFRLAFYSVKLISKLVPMLFGSTGGIV